jgi:tetratricopeptide (TPR) repeat protein
VTIQDKDQAAKERFRAKATLERAKELGDHSQLLENLLDTLRGMPSSGEIVYAERGDVDAAMKAGEAAFVRKDFDEAIKSYAHALELDPKSYVAALFIGDSYFAAGKFPQAGEWYDRATEIDPNRETAFRYHADMLTKQGDCEHARILSIKAIVADPYNQIPWRGLVAWSNASHVPLQPVHIQTGSSAAQSGGNNTTITIDANQAADVAAVWLAYGGSRALWQQEKFKKEFPKEPQYRHSLAEETDALTTAAKVAEEVGAKPAGNVMVKDPDVQLLLRIYRAQMIEPYVLLSAADRGIAQD